MRKKVFYILRDVQHKSQRRPDTQAWESVAAMYPFPALPPSDSVGLRTWNDFPRHPFT